MWEGQYPSLRSSGPWWFWRSLWCRSKPRAGPRDESPESNGPKSYSRDTRQRHPRFDHGCQRRPFPGCSKGLGPVGMKVDHGWHWMDLMQATSSPCVRLMTNKKSLDHLEMEMTVFSSWIPKAVSLFKRNWLVAPCLRKGRDWTSSYFLLNWPNLFIRGYFLYLFQEWLWRRYCSMPLALWSQNRYFWMEGHFLRLSRCKDKQGSCHPTCQDVRETDTLREPGTNHIGVILSIYFYKATYHNLFVIFQHDFTIAGGEISPQ